MKTRDALYFREMTIEDKQQVLEAIKEYIVAGSERDGILGEDKAKNFEDFLRLQEERKNIPFTNYDQEGYAPAESCVLVRKKDEKIVGFFSFRFHLTKVLDECGGGNLGYSIRPSERRKGYATEGVRLALEIMRERGLKSARIGCYADNIGSRKAIEHNGGKIIRKRETLITDLYYEIQL